MVIGSGIVACQSTRPLTDPAHDFSTGIGGVVLRTQVKSVREQRFRNVVPQQLDYSCGAASLATLLQFHYGDPVPEMEIVTDMLRIGDTDRIRHEGFSLLDLKRYAEHRGYEQGFQDRPRVVERLIPSITMINMRPPLRRARWSRHPGPALGERDMAKDEFLKEWNGVVFFVAAARDSDEPSPLEQLASTRRAPIELVRELDHFGLQSINLNPREF
jgi:predicted double-glycine peptidase